MPRPVLLLVVVALAGACTQLDDFTGTWTGSVVHPEAVRAGFSEHATASLSLEVLDVAEATGSLTTDATDEGRFDAAPLTRPRWLSSDALSTLAFDGADFANYLFFARPARGDPALVVVSLDPEDRIELRILRGEDLFGVFELTR